MSKKYDSKPGYYAIIPASVRYDNVIPPLGRLLYGEITALCNKYGYCYASNQYFANLYSKKPETISRLIKKLMVQKHISIEIIQELGNERRIFINQSLPYTPKSKSKRQRTIDKKVKTLLTKKSRPYCEKSQDPIDKKVKHNNTMNNTSKTHTEDGLKKSENFEAKTCVCVLDILARSLSTTEQKLQDLCNRHHTTVDELFHAASYAIHTDSILMPLVWIEGKNAFDSQGHFAFSNGNGHINIPELIDWFKMLPQETQESAERHLIAINHSWADMTESQRWTTPSFQKSVYEMKRQKEGNTHG